MILWRISEHRTLDGAGGLVVAGRWHSKGRPVVYLAESSALAMLEVLVHLETEHLPPPFQLLKVEVPDGLPRRDWPAERDAADGRATRGWGDEWLDAGETALARVPSVIAPGSHNWLFNPRAEGAEGVRIVDGSRWPWDRRLFR